MKTMGIGIVGKRKSVHDITVLITRIGTRAGPNPVPLVPRMIQYMILTYGSSKKKMKTTLVANRKTDQSIMIEDENVEENVKGMVILV